ncbi:hypothetical protein GGP41_009904 [Bipolaris sorokiniana]|uniref:Uncharacterized protein n=1 Tax=Cochliobolus sativus TaxID=45130 RepID=A0A8H6DW99_COCSA|nr:hypothetical protein GGP41_009904 [Bipolaris sorokiniana]
MHPLGQALVFPLLTTVLTWQWLGVIFSSSILIAVIRRPMTRDPGTPLHFIHKTEIVDKTMRVSSGRIFVRRPGHGCGRYSQGAMMLACGWHHTHDLGDDYVQCIACVDIECVHRHEVEIV